MINVQRFGKPPIGPLTGPQLQSQLAIRLSDPSEEDDITSRSLLNIGSTYVPKCIK